MCWWDQQVLQLGSLTVPDGVPQVPSAETLGVVAMCYFTLCSGPYISQYLTSGQQSGVGNCHCFVTLKLWRDQQVFALMLKRLWDWASNRGLCATVYTLCTFRWVLYQEASCRMQKALVVKVKNGKWMKKRMAREKIVPSRFSQYTQRD